MAMNHEMKIDSKRTVVWFLVLSAALPLTGVGMFAGALLAALVALWLLRAGRHRVANWELLMALAALALIENLVFIGFFLA